ncbi:MAG: hypothetical protein J5I94_24155 [Phaeodactylibacter sp.]|nr:hypothetical protein [Phaeodactylibacter sp.]
MFRKLAILTALLVAGALLSSVFAELATGKHAPIQAAEECAVTLSDGSDSLFPGFDEEGFSSAGVTPFFHSKERIQASAITPVSEAVKLPALKQPLFLLFHAFLFYGHV